MTSGLKPLRCPECGNNMVLRNSKYGQFWGCGNWPACDCTHGAHPDGRPLGVPANRVTRRARTNAHDAFDRLWGMGGRMSKDEAYKWLQGVLEMDPEECHIGRFDQQTCQRVVDLVEQELEKGA